MCVKELTEEGIPFLILFHQKDDTNSMEKFQQEVARQLIGEKGMHRDQKGSWAGQYVIFFHFGYGVMYCRVPLTGSHHQHCFSRH